MTFNSYSQTESLVTFKKFSLKNEILRAISTLGFEKPSESNKKFILFLIK